MKTTLLTRRRFLRTSLAVVGTARILADLMIVAGHGREPSREILFRG